VLLGSQDVSGSGASASDPTQDITQQLLNTLTSSTIVEDGVGRDHPAEPLSALLVCRDGSAAA